jgi:hypothetical protein
MVCAEVAPMMIRSFLAVAALLFTSACSQPSFQNDIQPIFARSCSVGGSTCHGATGTGGDLRLDPANAYANIVGHMSFEVATMPRIDPHHPENSFLLHKIRGSMYTEIPSCDSSTQNCGVVMPMVGGIMLSESEIELVRTWIEAGAPNN